MLIILTFVSLVNGGWRFTGFTECSTKCGGGKTTREKYCDDPKPQHGGQNCACDNIHSDEVFCDGRLARIEKDCNVCKCPGPCSKGK